MTKNRNLLAFAKLFFGLLGLSGIVTEVVVLAHRGTFAPGNFFSFFTVQSNVLGAVVLVGSAMLIFGGKRQGATYDLLRGAATLYMTITGVVFALLLSNLDANVLTAVPWDNTVLHYIMPCVLFADWLIDSPKRRISFKRALLWLSYPVAFLAYSLIRGHFVGWYPYPFLDAAKKGYAEVAVASLMVATVTMGLAWVVTRIARRRV